MSRFIVVGGGGHAKVVIGLLHKTGAEVLGYTDRADRGALLGAKYLGDDSDLPQRDDMSALAMGVGKVDGSPARRELRRMLAATGIEFPVIVSPYATVNEGAELGPGTVVCDGAVVSVSARVGELCILNTNSTVEHDCRLGANVHVAPGATLSGDVTVGDDSFLGAGCTVVQGVTICPGTVVGAGSTVLADIGTRGVYVGSPARRVR